MDYFFAARPLLHIPHWSIYLVSLNYHHKLSGQTFGATNLLVMLGITLLGAGAVYLNQVYDFRTDSINNKLPHLRQRLVKAAQLRTLFVLLSVAALILAAFAGIGSMFVFIQLFLLSYTYSAPPWRFKDSPLGGFFANAYGCGMLISFAVMPELNQHNAGLLGWDNPLYFFLSVGGVYLLTTNIDRPGDSLSGKRTIAVLFGNPTTVILAVLLFVAAAWLAIRDERAPLAFLAVMAALLSVVTLIVPGRLSALAPVAPIALLSALAAYWYPLYGLFIIGLILACRIYFKKRLRMNYPKFT